VFELGAEGARLVARHPWASEETISDRTGFEHTVADPLPVTPAPSPEYVRAIRTIDADGLRERLVG
jgi:glutaconate CoA-transferase subunit B